MKLSLSTALIFLITYQGLMRSSYVLWFHLKRDVISQTMCTNRDKPELKCNGRCVLSQKLKATSLDDERDALPLPPVKPEELQLHKGPLFNFDQLDMIILSLCFRDFQGHYSFDKDRSLDPPPWS